MQNRKSINLIITDMQTLNVDILQILVLTQGVPYCSSSMTKIKSRHAADLANHVTEFEDVSNKSRFLTEWIFIDCPKLR